MKRLMIVAMVTLLVAGVGGSAWAQTPEELLAVEKAIYAAVNAHNVDQIVSYFTDDAVLDYLVNGDLPYQGRAKVAAFFGAVFQGWPDYHVTQERELASGNIVVTECTITGTHQGVWKGIPATGKSVSGYPLGVFEFEGNKVKRLTIYEDIRARLSQMGLLPPPGSPPEPSFTLPDPEPIPGISPLDAAKAALVWFNAHDLVGMLKGAHRDMYYRDGGSTYTRGQWASILESNFKGLPDIQLPPLRFIDLGDGWVLEEVRLTALAGKIDLRAAYLLRFDADGLLMSDHGYADVVTLLVQVGAMEPLGPVIGPPTAVSPSTWGQIKATFQE